MAGAPPELKRRAAELLGQGKTVEEAAQIVGYSRRSLTKWMHDPELREVRHNARSAAQNPTAVATLRELLHSDNESTRLRAAIALMPYSERERTEDVGSEGDGSRMAASGARITVLPALPAPQPGVEPSDSAEESGGAEIGSPPQASQVQAA